MTLWFIILLMVNLKKHKKIIIIFLIFLILTAVTVSIYYVFFLSKSGFENLSEDEIRNKAGLTVGIYKTTNKEREESIKRTLDNDDAVFIDYLVASQNALELKSKTKVLEVTSKARVNIKDLDQPSEDTLRKIELQAEAL